MAKFKLQTRGGSGSKRWRNLIMKRPQTITKFVPRNGRSHGSQQHGEQSENLLKSPQFAVDEADSVNKSP